MKLTGTVYGHNEAELERNAEVAAGLLFAGKEFDVIIREATIEDVAQNTDGNITGIQFSAEFEAEAR